MDSGLRIINISNPVAPFEVNSITGWGLWAYSVAIAEPYLYVLWPGTILRVYDISDNVHPVEIGSCSGLGIGGNIILSGVYAYVEDYYTGLYIVNVFNPAAPTIAGFYNTSGTLIGTAGNYPFVYVVGNFGLKLANIANPMTPYEVGFYEDQIGFDVAYNGSYAYVSEGYYFSIYDCSTALAANPWETPPSAPSSFALHPCAPNPFNSTATLSYELRAASDVKLRVYDMAGRLVTTLVDGFQAGGIHEITFDGSGLTSGLYLARLEAGSFRQTQKLLLLK